MTADDDKKPLISAYISGQTAYNRLRKRLQSPTALTTAVLLFYRRLSAVVSGDRLCKRSYRLRTKKRTYKTAYVSAYKSAYVSGCQRYKRL